MPFSRQQRSLAQQQSKAGAGEPRFGTPLDARAVGHEWVNHALAPAQLPSHDFRVTIGAGGISCTQPYAASVFNISSMSFGALSASAIVALNAGARRGAARVHRPRGRAAAGGLGAGAQHARRTQPAQPHPPGLRGQGDPRLRPGAGRRLVQLGARLHVRAGLHPDPDLPHGPVSDEGERVYRFHQNTLQALKDGGQAAGLHHPRELTAQHIVRRASQHRVRLLARELTFVAPGALLETVEGCAEWPAAVCSIHWPMARADSFRV